MAKKGATQSSKAGSTPKSTVTDNKSKTQKADRRKSNEPAVEKVVDKEEEWEDEDSEDDEGTAPKANGSKTAKRQAEDEDSSEEDSDSEDSEDDEEHGGIDLAAIDDSDSASELDSDGEAEKRDGKYDGEEKKEDNEENEEEEEEEIDVDELSAEDEEDEEQIAAGTRVRQTINNKEGLLAALRRFALDTNPKTVPFAFHQSIVSSKKTEDSIPSIDDDLQRELAFVNQSLEAARQGRALLRKEGVPFTRPTDYFAETVRSDETMQKVKAKLVEEATAKKAAAEARKQRDLKKFGKQVQVQKLQERAKQKRETLDKINLLKRKRQEGGSSALGTTEADDLFDVAVDNELSNSKSSSSKKRAASGDGHHGPPNAKRQKKDAKYGFGGKKRFAKSGDALSSGDLSGFSAKRMKSGGFGGAGAGGKKKGVKAPRPGKSRRKAMAGKR
ncbi:eukaryotic rRNA processing protein EBP2-domain-containing protein [Achaetomium macrosporum]|uniref:Eukaryotic rRNA processing protein EBP2-domain-containing protein n=1 Tax=Achaetomium macrosporum TaxID=79813 RepID=A0AAN7HFN8_9PEZI|nr:eukaryotic rRNA processing protein EBP2-domain-containing protein [Achaetomium macrosporum]